MTAPARSHLLLLMCPQNEFSTVIVDIKEAVVHASSPAATASSVGVVRRGPRHAAGGSWCKWRKPLQRSLQLPVPSVLAAAVLRPAAAYLPCHTSPPHHSIRSTTCWWAAATAASRSCACCPSTR